MDITNPDVDPLPDAHLALQTAASLQESIRHADAKAQMLLGLAGGVVVVVGDHTSMLFHASLPRSVAALVLSTIMVGGLALTAGRLLAVITPRLTRPQGRNRFAFPSTASQSHPATADVSRYRDEAWQLVTTLSKIAAAKHLGVRRSVVPLAVALAAGAVLLVLALATGNVM
jgi:hypothetical protein